MSLRPDGRRLIFDKTHFWFFILYIPPIRVQNIKYQQKQNKQHNACQTPKSSFEPDVFLSHLFLIHVQQTLIEFFFLRSYCPRTAAYSAQGTHYGRGLMRSRFFHRKRIKFPHFRQLHGCQSWLPIPRGSRRILSPFRTPLHSKDPRQNSPLPVPWI